MTAFRDPLVETIAAFLRGIGLEVRAGDTGGCSVLPGIGVARGALIVDETCLAYPGDILHEAGHLAVAPAERRAAAQGDVGNDAGEELMAIAWSYAAATHLGLDPHLVFHAGGYRRGGENLVAAFRSGALCGQPLLEHYGMTFGNGGPPPQGETPFPHMQRWLR